MMMDAHFSHRHIGLSETDKQAMLSELGISCMDDFINQVVPKDIRYLQALAIPKGINENEALAQLKSIFAEVESAKSLIGQGYYHCHMPSVIRRHILENPRWYTSYTPYQAEISQGRLQMLFNFQTLVVELTGLPTTNASLLDEATAISESIAVAINAHRGKRNKILLLNSLFQQSQRVVETRCQHNGVELLSLDQYQVAENMDDNTAALVIQYPDCEGKISHHASLIEKAKAHNALIIIAADPMALLLTAPPSSWGADIVVGSMQRFGLPLGNGGPHAAYMATTEELTRLIPGRIVGQSIDQEGHPVYRLSLQTREQHIRREKANSNICTAQALLANMVAAYAIWHGPKQLVEIARNIHNHGRRFAKAINHSGNYVLIHNDFFDTLTIQTKSNAYPLQSQAEAKNLLLHCVDDNHLTLSFDETTNEHTLQLLATIFAINLPELSADEMLSPDEAIVYRGDDFLSQEVFHQYHSETAMMRYLTDLADKDYALSNGMIPLGSCTMKLNAAAEMIPITWEKIANLHPFAPEKYQQGYRHMIEDLNQWLCAITGFSRISFQPNSGSQGEYAGLVAIKNYHLSQGQKQRNICLIPASAHGTNPASASIVGMEIVIIECDSKGNVDMADLQAKATQHSNRLSTLMITYPSTHGVFESHIKTICQMIHRHGGQVYLDGANLNALVGLSRLADLGADVCHMNLHKTFCIPHGGGGPGVGPIGVADHLIPFLPTTSNKEGIRIAGAPFGSASILPITWMYIRMLGCEGLKHATECAILSANYLAKKLEAIFPVLYKGKNGFVAHECIIDTRLCKPFASVDDIAKRLMDYGFHAPTMSWPVIGTLMIEPTESEPKVELDRFIDAMQAIAKEIKKIEHGEWQKDNNPLINAPHTLAKIISSEYDYPYCREIACALEHTSHHKYWAPVSRVDNAYGDRNLSCSCPPLKQYR